MFYCPSDSLADVTPTFGVFAAYDSTLGIGTGAFIGGFWYYPAGGGGEAFGRTNYVGVAGLVAEAISPVASNAPYFAGYNGIMKNRNKMSLGQITVLDGTSNTLMMGETLGGSGGPVRDTVIPWIASGSQGVLLGLGRGQSNESPALPRLVLDANNSPVCMLPASSLFMEMLTSGRFVSVQLAQLS